MLGGIEQPKIASVIGLFRRESSGSAQDSRASSESSLHHVSGPESPPAPGAVLLIEEGGPPEPLASMLGVPRRPPVGRRGSMLELGSTTVNSIPEEETTTPLTSPQNSPMSDQRWMALRKGSASLSRLAGRLSALVSSSSSSSSSDDSSNEDDEEVDEKCAINRTQN